MSTERRGTREWDPWLAPCVDPTVRPGTRVCTFCSWPAVFVRKRAFSHFGVGGTSASDRCKRAPRPVFIKFRECHPKVPARMTYDEMYNTKESQPSAEPTDFTTVDRDDGGFQGLQASAEPSHPHSNSVDLDVQRYPRMQRRSNTPTSS